MENIKPSYEEACTILRHIIDVDFPTKENITHAFVQQEVLAYMVIWGNYSQEIKSALSIVLGEVMRNEQSVKKIIKKDNTDHKLLWNFRKNKITSPTIKEIQENTKENILPIKEETIIESKIEKINPIEEKTSVIENISQPIIKKEKVTINPDSKIWEDNIRVIKGIEFTDENRKIALIIIHDLIKKYVWDDENKLFIEKYTKPDPQNKDDIVYRIQPIRMDIHNKTYQKSLLQKIIISIENILHIE